MLAIEIAQYLAAQGLGTFSLNDNTGNIFIENLPPSPDSCIMIRSTGGYGTEGKDKYDSPTIQIIKRDSSLQTAYDASKSIYNKLHGFHHKTFVVNGIWVLNCLGIQSEPAYLGQDENSRHEYSINFELSIKNDGRLS